MTPQILKANNFFLEVKRFEESMFSCTWLLQQTATML